MPSVRHACLWLLIALGCALMFAREAEGLDVSWVPQGDGPLPASKNYRDKLRMLCRTIMGKDKARALAGLTKADKQNIKRQCVRLDQADKAGPEPEEWTFGFPGGSKGMILKGVLFCTAMLALAGAEGAALADFLASLPRRLGLGGGFAPGRGRRLAD